MREETLEKLLLENFACDPELAANFRSHYDLVAERKARLYPHLQRMIIDVKFRRESESQVFFEVLHQPVPSNSDGKPN